MTLADRISALATRIGTEFKLVRTQMAALKPGFPAGTGGTVTQLTNKATAVTLNKDNGNITMAAAALAAGAIVTFTLTNSQAAVNDLIVTSHHAGGTVGPYLINGRVSAAGTIMISVRNTSAASLAEAIVIKFAIVKGTIA